MFVVKPGGYIDMNIRVKFNLSQFIGQFNFIDIGKVASITLVWTVVFHRQVVNTQEPYPLMG